MCQIVSIAFNDTFTSPLAIKLVNISALGFLSALAFLAFLPLPGMHRCAGFAGFSGFFGLIGVAVIVELSSRRKATKAAGNSLDSPPREPTGSRPRPEPQAGAPAPRLLKSDAGFVTTPEQLGTFDSQFFLFRHRSQLLLDDCQLTVSRAGAFTIIPLAAIRDLSIGHYPRIMHPVGLDFISATYDENGKTKRLFISPYESWFGLPSTFNRFVAEWFAAIRAAVVEATGCQPGNTPAKQLGVPPGSKALFALLLFPLILGSTLVLAVLRLDTGDVTISPFLGGALAIVLGVLGFGFFALVLGRVFGDGSSRGFGGSPRQAAWLPPEATTGKWNVFAPDASRWGSVLVAAAVVAIPLGALLGKELHHRAKSANDVALMSVAFMLYLGVGAIVVFLSWHATRLLRSLLRRGATAPSSAVSFTSPSPPRASAWPGVVFMIGMAMLMTLVVITVFVGVLSWWMK